MADFQFNIAKGRVVEMAANADDLRMLVLKTGDTEANLQDMNDIAEILAGTPVEADFTNYVAAPTGKTLTGVTDLIDDTGNTNAADFTNVVFSSAGGATNNNCVAVIVYKFVTNNADSIPLTYHDAVFVTNGSDVNINLPAAGFLVAS